ncbi:MAG: ankyrin repeat domain-containing protein [Candidatus Wallbacteria bacterium]|nr:ankyrin repeat domain-containing protein [Candidatus Wallbacteria bacterium]
MKTALIYLFLLIIIVLVILLNSELTWGLRQNIFITCSEQRSSMAQYIDGWLNNLGCLPDDLYFLHSGLAMNLKIGNNLGNLRTFPFRPGCPFLATYMIRNHLSGVECLCKLHNPLKFRSIPPEPQTLVAAISEWELSPSLKLTGLKKAYEFVLSGYDLNERDSQGRTSLMLAVRFGFSDFANFLLDKGDNVQAKDSIGYSAIQYALRCCSDSFLFFDSEMNNKSTTAGLTLYRKTLLPNGKNFAAAFSFLGIHRNILFALCDGTGRVVPGSMEHLNEFASQIALRLISLGADVSCIGPGGRTLLMEAVYLNLKDVCAALIAKGVDINVRDNQGLTALKIARLLKYDDIIGFLVKAGAKE